MSRARSPRFRQIRWLILWLSITISISQAQLPGTGFQGQRPQVPPLQQANPFQRRQPNPVQGQGLFPAQRNPLNPLGNPLASPLTGAGLQNPYTRYNQYQQQNYVPITAYQNELNLDGSFSYGYSSADGTTAQAQGYVKNLGYGEGLEAQVIQGSYSYTSPEGTPITVRYIADENGFRAEGTGIPASPQYFLGAQPYQQPGGVINPNLNPYQTPFRQLPPPLPNAPFRPQIPGQGQQPLNPLQQQQQQQQQRNFQQQQNSGQYQPDQPFNQLHSGNLPGQYAGQFGQPGQQYGSNLTAQQAQQQQQQQQQNLNQQQQNLQNQQQNLNQQQKEQQNEQQQQALITQQLRGRPNNLVDPYGYNQYGRRFKKSPKTPKE